MVEVNNFVKIKNKHAQRALCRIVLENSFRGPIAPNSIIPFKTYACIPMLFLLIKSCWLFEI